ncbi:hypothetical protein WJ969_08655 [Achromobacter xylosoxidans]
MTHKKLCASRANGKTVPFEIDSRYLKSARSFNPDATFIAIDGISPQLVECHLRKGTGKYEPASYSPEGNNWRLIRPKQFKPGINTPKGQSMAAKVCVDAAPRRSTALISTIVFTPRLWKLASMAPAIAQAPRSRERKRNDTTSQ